MLNPNEIPSAFVIIGFDELLYAFSIAKSLLLFSFK